MPRPGSTSVAPTYRRDRILTDEALAFVADLQRRFGPVRLDLLGRRQERQAELDAGIRPDFLVGDDRRPRGSDWKVAPAPADLEDRRVEITGPAEPKMMINALNSGARVFMADLEDALSPTWANVVGGQAAIADATRGTLDLRFARGQVLPAERAPRHARSSGRAAGTSSSRTSWSTACRSRRRCSTSGCTCSIPARRRSSAGAGRTCTSRSSSRTARRALWNEVFVHAQAALGIPRGQHPRDGPDRDDPRRVRDGRDPVRAARARRGAQRRTLGLPVQRHQEVPDVARTSPRPTARSSTMTVPFMRAYTELLVRTCHRRGAHAIGGMAAFIPNRRDPEVTDRAMARVRDDKERESGDGFDGTWVAHPDLVPLATEIFDGVLGDRAAPEGRGSRERSHVVATTCSTSAWPAARSPRPGSGRTSASRWPTSTRGCAARARRPSTT